MWNDLHMSYYILKMNSHNGVFIIPSDILWPSIQGVGRLLRYWTRECLVAAGKAADPGALVTNVGGRGGEQFI